MNKVGRFEWRKAAASGRRTLPARSGFGLLCNRRQQDAQSIRRHKPSDSRLLVANGYGVTLLPEMAVPFEAGRSKHIAVHRFAEPQPRRTVGLAWRRSSPRTQTSMLSPAFLRRSTAARSHERGEGVVMFGRIWTSVSSASGGSGRDLQTDIASAPWTASAEGRTKEASAASAPRRVNASVMRQPPLRRIALRKIS
jgi:hypothetical protein